MAFKLEVYFDLEKGIPKMLREIEWFPKGKEKEVASIIIDYIEEAFREVVRTGELRIADYNPYGLEDRLLSIKGIGPATSKKIRGIAKFILHDSRAIQSRIHDCKFAEFNILEYESNIESYEEEFKDYLKADYFTV